MRKLSFSARYRRQIDTLIIALTLIGLFGLSIMWLIEAGEPYP